MIFLRENDIKPHITLAQFKDVWSKKVVSTGHFRPRDLMHKNNETWNTGS